MDDLYLFIITIVGLSFTFVGGMITFFLRSKCSNVSCCCGLVNVTRDIDNELKEELVELDHGINPYKFDTSSETKH